MENTPPTAGDGRFLTRPVSVYLDIVRFLAALAVLIGHAADDGLYHGPYFLYGLGHEAVMVFFVLSGLVIASTTIRPGRSLRGFVVARLARVYPVVIPAILLSFALYALAGWLGINAPGWAADPSFSWLTALGSLFFLNESWGSEMILPWNFPYWSICYEVFYYAMFGCLVFGRGPWRWLFFLLAALLAGPRVLALAPVWAMGVWIALDPRLRLKSPLLGLALVVATWAAILWMGAAVWDDALKTWLHATISGWWRLVSSEKMLTDHLLGLLVMANFIGFHACAPWFAGLMARIERPVRVAAGSTFSLYLFHRPMTHFLVAAGFDSKGNALVFTGFLLLIVTLCFLLAEVTEKRRDAARRIIGALLNRIVPARLTAA
ncbi:acyltransferase family protein [Pedomonas mirosovicensis]|uniref:acyltransferase family protein n=1 Tax=Pedomonas mirosovicensis TaxID=2908641 RepID=UPI00216802C1|nr:acyltransferase [Pedomonas mirosovicensis]MCH8683978.1 acyltransferase [Pedomonas mirosovicensis]